MEQEIVEEIGTETESKDDSTDVFTIYTTEAKISDQEISAVYTDDWSFLNHMDQTEFNYAYQDGKVYYIQVVETEEDMGKAHVCAMDRQGRVERLDTVSLKHPFLKSQFFLSQDQALLWMDYSGQIFVKELGSGAKLEIEGITGVENRFLGIR